MQDLDGGFEAEALARPVVDPGDGGVAGELAPIVVGDGAGDALEAARGAAQGVGRLGLGLARDGCREEQPGPARKSVTSPPQCPAPTTVSPSLLAEALRLLRPVSAKPRVPLQLPRHRRRGTAEPPRDLRPAVARLRPRLDVISLVRGRVGVALCHGNTPLF